MNFSLDIHLHRITMRYKPHHKEHTIWASIWPHLFSSSLFFLSPSNSCCSCSLRSCSSFSFFNCSSFSFLLRSTSSLLFAACAALLAARASRSVTCLSRTFSSCRGQVPYVIWSMLYYPIRKYHYGLNGIYLNAEYGIQCNFVHCDVSYIYTFVLLDLVRSLRKFISSSK